MQHPTEKQIRIFDWDKFSEHCRASIKLLGISQARVARECKLGTNRVSDILRKKKTCSVDTLLKLCIYLQLDPISFTTPYYKWKEAGTDRLRVESR